MGKLLTEIGKRTADLGVPLGYHNHMNNLGERPEEVRAVLGAADPKLRQAGAGHGALPDGRRRSGGGGQGIPRPAPVPAHQGSEDADSRRHRRPVALVPLRRARTRQGRISKACSTRSTPSVSKGGRSSSWIKCRTVSGLRRISRLSRRNTWKRSGSRLAGSSGARGLGHSARIECMRIFALFVFAVIGTTASVASLQKGAPDGARTASATTRNVAGWTLLFDGSTLSGWRGYKRSDAASTRWKVQDGMLTRGSERWKGHAWGARPDHHRHLTTTSS